MPQDLTPESTLSDGIFSLVITWCTSLQQQGLSSTEARAKVASYLVSLAKTLQDIDEEVDD